MLLYALLTVAGVLVAAIVVWVMRSVTSMGRSTYRSVSSTARNASGPKLAHLNSSLASTPAPWGWGGKKASGKHRGESPRAATLGDRVARTSNVRGHETYKQQFDREHSKEASVRNVLTGYDIHRKTEPDTSCWPYQDTFGKTRSSLPTETLSKKGKQPSKPWGW